MGSVVRCGQSTDDIIRDAHEGKDSSAYLHMVCIDLSQTVGKYDDWVYMKGELGGSNAGIVLLDA